jgi:formylglycine-generating enzyme required for sulfatase activity
VDRNWRSPGFTQTDRHPVVCVSWNDAKAYVAWLSSTTGRAYRLLSETEREYVARAGTTTPFWWGSSITPAQANYDGTLEPYTGGGSKGEYRKATVAVDTFAANAWGLYNVHGNVWEWTEDCWNERNPGNADAQSAGYCDRVLRGGSWDSNPGLLRSAYRSGILPALRGSEIGFRVARTLSAP